MTLLVRLVCISGLSMDLGKEVYMNGDVCVKLRREIRREIVEVKDGEVRQEGVTTQCPVEGGHTGTHSMKW